MFHLGFIVISGSTLASAGGLAVYFIVYNACKLKLSYIKSVVINIIGSLGLDLLV